VVTEERYNKPDDKYVRELNLLICLFTYGTAKPYLPLKVYLFAFVSNIDLLSMHAGQ